MDVMNHNLGGVRWVASEPVTKIINLEQCCWRSCEKVTYLWQIAVSICNIFSRNSNGSCESVERLLESHMRIVLSIALISLLIQRLHKLYQPGSYTKLSLAKLCGRLVQISNSSCAASSKTESM